MRSQKRERSAVCLKHAVQPPAASGPNGERAELLSALAAEAAEEEGE